MDFNKTIFGDLRELVSLYELASLTLINEHKATDEDFKNFLIKLLQNDFNYHIYFNNNILELVID